jgi:2-dehydro-3-deoxyphosphogluconate aldolase/(4S)-4-hydroxy-2-oxoglutarate aldolase
MFKEILETKLVPVVVFKDLSEVEPTLSGLRSGGVNIAEICFRTEVTAKCLQKAIELYPDMLIGAGTIISADQALEAINLGAKFIVSPGLSASVANVCKEHNIPYIPGVVTPSEIIAALDLGLTYLKFFPAGVFGGLKAIKALASAFPQIKIMPTGGVDNSNLGEFIKEKSIFAIGGSWLTKGDITANCIEALNIIKGE